MDSGLVIAFVPFVFVGGLAISFLLRLLLVPGWVAVLSGTLAPPLLLLVADFIGSHGSYTPDAETVIVIAAIFMAAAIPALIGALCGLFLWARTKHRQGF